MVVQTSLPVRESNARKRLSSVAPMKTRPPAVAMEPLNERSQALRHLEEFYPEKDVLSMIPILTLVMIAFLLIITMLPTVLFVPDRVEPMRSQFTGVRQAIAATFSEPLRHRFVP